MIWHVTEAIGVHDGIHVVGHVHVVHIVHGRSAEVALEDWNVHVLVVKSCVHRFMTNGNI